MNGYKNQLLRTENVSNMLKITKRIQVSQFYRNIWPKMFTAVGFNKHENPADFKPVSMAVKITKLYSKTIHVTEHEKNIKVCPNYIGGPLTYYNSTTKLTSLIGIGNNQSPYFFQCNNKTTQVVTISYQLMDKVVDWVKEQIGNDTNHKIRTPFCNNIPNVFLSLIKIF